MLSQDMASMSRLMLESSLKFCKSIVPIALLTIGSLSPVLADEELVCPGENLLPQWERDDPVQYRAAIAKSEAIPNGNAIFWKVEKPGIEPSWLFGTVHVSDDRVLNKPEGFDDAYNDIDALVVELEEIAHPEKMALELLKHPELTTLQGDMSLDRILPPDATAKLASDLKKKGIDMMLMAKMRPWLLYANFQTRGCDIRRRASGLKILDESLAIQALEDDVELIGLETPLEQMQALADVPDALMLENVREILALPNGIDDIIETTIGLYDQGKIGMVYALTDLLSTNDTATQAFMNRIVIDRNKIMAERAERYLDSGRVMIAVGALHLPGEYGLVELLRNQGFTLTAVN